MGLALREASGTYLANINRSNPPSLPPRGCFLKVKRSGADYYGLQYFIVACEERKHGTVMFLSRLIAASTKLDFCFLARLNVKNTVHLGHDDPHI